MEGRELVIRSAREHNLRDVDARIPLGTFVAVTGVSGSGKSTLINDILWNAAVTQVLPRQDGPGAHDGISGLELLDKIVDIDQSPIGRTPRSNPATYTGLFTIIRELFAELPESKMRGYSPGRFSFNVKGGRCEACQGDGLVKIEMHFLPDVYVPCEVCRGRRYNRETLEVFYKGHSIADVLDLTVDEGCELFDAVPRLKRQLQTLSDVGLGYIHLGQSATTLSGGEAQRVKLASELSKVATGQTFYILDEPTTGLHFEDVRMLLEVLHRLVERGNTVLVIEHNLDVIKTADWIIDLGPEGGPKGRRDRGVRLAGGRGRQPAQPHGALPGRHAWRDARAGGPRRPRARRQDPRPAPQGGEVARRERRGPPRRSRSNPPRSSAPPCPLRVRAEGLPFIDRALRTFPTEDFMTIRIILIAAAALLAAVPAPAQQQSMAGCQAIGTRPLNRRAAADSVRLAAQRVVLDSLKSAVLDAARQSGVAQPEGLVILEVRGPRPERTEIHLWRANVSDAVVRGVLASRGPLLATLPQRETTLHFRLSYPSRDGARGDSLMECLPRPTDLSQFVQEITRASQSQPPLPAGSNPNTTLQVRMLVSREGEVAHARLSRRTHQPSLDAAILAAARRLRFVPASVGGAPVDVWVEQPVHLQVEVEPRRSRP